MMYSLNTLISIDKRFQNSVNLHLDLEKDDKLNSYIPTRSSLKIMEEYLESITGKRQEKATILIGPYGKGKSHLLLVLLRLISEKNTKKLHKILEEIKGVDPYAAELEEQFLKAKKPYLPVVISSTGDDLNQSFLLGLVEALKRAHLGNIIPDTFFSEAVKMIEIWKKDYPETYQRLEKEQEVAVLCEKLNAMDQRSYELFQKIYTKLTSGGVFNPMVQTEMLSIYQSVCRQLCEKCGYAGIYIIFDEFSKYIEGHKRDTFSRDMKIIQDMCELASASKENSIHITFVAHKSIKEYGTGLPAEMQNAFTGVEGRLKEKLFVVSSQNNYELIQSVIKKNNDQYKKIIKESADWQDVLENTYQMPCFCTTFEKKDYDSIIADGCFPLLPLTAYLLLGISEKVAQNERSVFTFLANPEKGTLAYRVEKKEVLHGGIGADMVYDYFQNMFRENKAQTSVHAEWLKADYALSVTQDKEEQSVIKVLALILMIRNAEEVPAEEKTIRLACGLEEKIFADALDRLLEKHLILKRRKTGFYAFKNNVAIDLDEKIKELSKKQLLNLSVTEAIAGIADLTYLLPKQHNQKYTMTRYFQYQYMTVEQFLALPNAECLFEEKRADGKIICIIPGNEERKLEKVEEQLQSLHDKRIVVLYPKILLDQEMNIRKYQAIKLLQKDQDFTENNKALIQELNLYEEDLYFEINARLEEMYLPENEQCDVLYINKVPHRFRYSMEFNRFLSQIFDEYYASAPKVNNEQINRQNITSQINRARNKIISCLLSGEDFDQYLKGTSPESTIFRATMLHTGICGKATWTDAGSMEVLCIIASFIESCAGKKHSFIKLYKTLSGENYGVRKGVIPIFIAKQLAALEDTPIVYLQEKEVELSAEILQNINEKPEDYFLYVEVRSAEKEQYLKNLEEAFLTEKEKNVGIDKNHRLSSLVMAMQRWYRALPQSTLNFKNKEENYTAEEYERMNRFRNLFRKMELNSRELLFEQIPNIYYHSEQKESLGEQVLATKKCFDNMLPALQKNMISIIKDIFHAKKGESLWGVLKNWYLKQSAESKSYIKNEQITGFMGYLEQIQKHQNYNEVEIADRIAKIITDLYMEDWTEQVLGEFSTELLKVKNDVEKIHGQESLSGSQNKISFTGSDGKQIEKVYEKEEDDSTGYFLQNAIEEAIEEFGESLEMNQKVSVLIQTLEKIISNQ